MGRPRKNNAEYFTHDSGMRNDVKIRALRRKFSHMGYAVWNYLLEALTDSADFRIKWDEVNIDLYSADFDVTQEELADVVQYCKKIDLLKIDPDGYIYSETLCERFNTLINKRSKDREPASGQENSANPRNKPEFCGVSDSENPEKNAETPQNSPETPQNSQKSDEIVPEKGVIAAETPQNGEKTDKKGSFSGFPSRDRVEYSKEEKSREENISSSRTREATPEERKEFFEIFFFRNFTDPDREVERFVAWNAKQGNIPTRYDAELWNPEDKGKRFPESFLKAWKSLYAIAKHSGPDGAKCVDAMLDSRVSMKALNGKWILTCADTVAMWLNGNPDAAKEYMSPVLKGYPLAFKTYRRSQP